MIAPSEADSPTAAPVPTPVVDDRSEEEIQLGIRRALEVLGFYVYDLSQGRATRQTPGLADLYVVGHGRCAWLEVKRPVKGKQSEAQEVFEQRVRSNGGEYLVVRSESDAIAWAERVRAQRAS
jgi:hypothetical protein